MFQMVKIFWFIAIILFLSIGITPGLRGDTGIMDTAQTNNQTKKIILLGASLGKAWDIPSFPKRVKNFDYEFEYVGSGSFDKTERLKDILARKENKPDAIFIKECAAYFPGDLENYKMNMIEWITKCQEENVVPIPATVVPVTRLHSFKLILIDIIKGRNPFLMGNPFHHKRNVAILEYNDWLKEYCEKNGLSFLDLEAAVRYSEKNRFLMENLAFIDGLHLISKAYGRLDQIVIPTLESVVWKERGRN